MSDSERYVIERLLGAGGMGQVYLAQDTRLNRKIALKLLRGANNDLVDRMIREARAQARVIHDNICKVYDAGEFDGKPYIAMQFVDGCPIDQAAREMSLRQKVIVLRDVAEAVQAAHNHGLVHRDLKPGNVMVEQSDPGVWHPYVLDFGIALELEAPGMTTTGTIRGTPAYMAPEQIRGGRDELDHRADIYSLGIVLYELLSGGPPFTAATPIELLIKALEEPPPSLRKTARDVPVDLRVIVEKCLEKEPERRYRSARALAEDLDRFLANEPVMARPATWTYRLRKQIARHKIVASTVAVSLVVLLAGVVKYTIDLHHERGAAMTAREEAEEVTDFLLELFSVADPSASRGNTITARELLDRGADRIETDLGNRPVVKARMMNVIGHVYQQLGLYDESERMLSNSLLIRAESLSADHPDIAISKETLANTLYWLGEYDRAEVLYNEALQIWKTDGVDPLLKSFSLHGLANVAFERGDYDRARLMFELHEQTVRRHGGDDHRFLAQALYGLASVHREMDEYEQAVVMFQQVLETYKLHYGADAPEVASALDNLGLVYHRLGKRDLAVDMLNQSLDLRRRLFGSRSVKVATVLNNLGMVSRAAARYEQAEEWYTETLDIYTEILGPDHYWTGIALANLGRVNRERGHYVQAEAQIERALEIYLATAGEKQPKTGIVLYTFALVYCDQGRRELALSFVDRAMKVFEDSTGSESLYIAATLEVKARAFLSQQRSYEAKVFLLRALTIRESAHEHDDPRLASCRIALADTLAALGDSVEAENQYQQAEMDLEAFLQGQESNVPAIGHLARVNLGLGLLSDSSRDSEAAQTRFRRADELLSGLDREQKSMSLLAVHARTLLALGLTGQARSLMAVLEAAGWGERIQNTR